MPFHKVISEKQKAISQKAISIIKTYLLFLISYFLSLISYLLFLISYFLSLISYLLSLISYHSKVKQGFTLVEILVVITIIGILGSLTTVTFDKAREKARDTARKQDLAAIKSALSMYYLDNSRQYPYDTTDTARTAFASDAAANWIPGLVEGGYIKQLPKDPKQAGLITRLANLLPKFGGAKAPPGPQPQVAGATYVSYSTATANWVNTITVNKPAGVLSGDLLIAYISKTMYGVGDLAPSGWTLIRTDSNSSCCRSGIYYKVATSSEPASYTWNIAGSETYGIGTIQVYRD